MKGKVNRASENQLERMCCIQRGLFQSGEWDGFTRSVAIARKEKKKGEGSERADQRSSSFRMHQFCNLILLPLPLPHSEGNNHFTASLFFLVISVAIGL